MGEPNDSDREWAYVLDGQDSDRLGTVVLHRLECERAERERVLDEIDACLVCRAIDSDANVLDALGQVIAKLRQP